MSSRSNPTSFAPSPRRGFLLGTLRALGALLAFRGTGTGMPMPPPLPRPDPESLAALGARFAGKEPATATGLAREVDAQLPGWLRVAGRERRMRMARRVCLAPERIAAELARADVVEVDGWILARSEAALASFAHREGARRGART